MVCIKEKCLLSELFLPLGVDCSRKDSPSSVMVPDIKASENRLIKHINTGRKNEGLEKN